MIQKGKIKQWNVKRGFGFIQPLAGGRDVFLHISEISNKHATPQEGELFSFEVQVGGGGKPRAINVKRLGERGLIKSNRYKTRRHSGGLTFLKRVFRFVPLLAIAYVAYISFTEFDFRLLNQDEPYKHSETMLAPHHNEALQQFESQVFQFEKSSSGFKCDGRQYCSQMKSKDEALFFIRNCPNTKMDGDHDGRPCERHNW